MIAARAYLKPLKLILPLLFLALFNVSAFADTIFLKNGTVREGKIIQENDSQITVEIRVGGLKGQVIIPRADIQTIERKAIQKDTVLAEGETLSKKAEALNGQAAVDAWLKVGDHYVDYFGYSSQANDAYQKVLKIDTDNMRARNALGFVRTAAGWKLPLDKQPRQLKALKEKSELLVQGENSGLHIGRRKVTPPVARNNQGNQANPGDQAQADDGNPKIGPRPNKLEERIAHLENKIDQLLKMMQRGEVSLEDGRRLLRSYGYNGVVQPWASGYGVNYPGYSSFIGYVGTSPYYPYYSRNYGYRGSHRSGHHHHGSGRVGNRRHYSPSPGIVWGNGSFYSGGFGSYGGYGININGGSGSFNYNVNIGGGYSGYRGNYGYRSGYGPRRF